MARPKNKKTKSLVQIMQLTLGQISPIRLPVKRKIQTAVFLMLIASCAFLVYKNPAIFHADTINTPKITIISPQDKAALTSQPIHLKAFVSDDAKIVEMIILIDGKQVDQTSGTTINYLWYFDNENIEKGSHTITFISRDSDNHSATKSITVNKL